MQLILINDGHNPECEELIVAAAKKRKIPVEVTNSKIRTESVAPFRPIKKTLVYRIATNPIEELLETILIGKGAVSLREADQLTNKSDLNLLMMRKGKLRMNMFLSKNKIATPETIFSNATDSKSLKEIIKKLGLPLLIKTLDSSRGKGVILIDSFFGLRSSVEAWQEKEIPFLYQKFIQEATGSHIRAIVLDGRLICAYRKSVPKQSDFRSNASGGLSANKLIKLSPTTEKLAIETVNASGLAFGGVDLIKLNQQDYCVAEVNFPFNFARSAKLGKFDVAGKMLDYLVAKAQRS